eukprot:NODE_298_length_2497_cov_20.255310_g275_i0.p1 GENE.NODE_298_length_2497_cov_20.255310_g275_i0~~NODE_298_length_2497_cov_20.255310_g275_i0.p1  ORF type:complete len:198 (+),score=23.23 NODE_298_length_2497_cov_20.255310_g275_i0:175-768(+)
MRRSLSGVQLCLYLCLCCALLRTSTAIREETPSGSVAVSSRNCVEVLQTARRLLDSRNPCDHKAELQEAVQCRDQSVFSETARQDAARLCFQNGFCAFSSNRYGDAIASFEQCKASGAYAQWLLPALHAYTALSYFQLAQFQEAHRSFERCVAACLQQPEVTHQLLKQCERGFRQTKGWKFAQVMRRMTGADGIRLF